jgi:integrase
VAAIREREKRGKPVFHVQVRMRGFPARTASFPTRRLAERWAKTIEASMIEGKHFRGVEARRRTLAEAIERYIKEELPKKRDARTRLIRLNWWKDKLGHLTLADITPAVIVECRGKLSREHYTRARPGAPASTLEEGEAAREFTRAPPTINRYLAYLSHALTIARREWHWLDVNPFDGVGRLKEGAGRVRVLNDVERKALLAHTAKGDPRLHLLVRLALATAARAGELLALTWPDVDTKAGRLLLKYTKNDQPRVVWVRGEALRLLRAHARTRVPGEARLFVSDTGKEFDYRPGFEAACTAAKLSGVVFHSLRHSAATMLAREGASEQQLRAIGGWKSGIVSRYVHLAAADGKDVLAKMAAKI